MTEADDHLFCLITMNHHPLHINDVYAAESQQGRNVVVGPLVYSLALGMSVGDVSGKAIANLATEELTHPAPVFHGDTLFAETEVLEVQAVAVQARPRRGARSTRASSSRTARSWPSSSAPCWCRAASRARTARGASGRDCPSCIRARPGRGPPCAIRTRSSGSARSRAVASAIASCSLGREVVLAVAGPHDAVDSRGVRHDGRAGRERLEHLVLDARPRARRHEGHGGAVQLGGHARHVGRDLHAVQATQLGDLRGGARTRDPERRARHGPAQQGNTSRAASRAGATLWK